MTSCPHYPKSLPGTCLLALQLAHMTLKCPAQLKVYLKPLSTDYMKQLCKLMLLLTVPSVVLKRCPRQVTCPGLRMVPALLVLTMISLLFLIVTLPLATTSGTLGQPPRMCTSRLHRFPGLTP